MITVDEKMVNKFWKAYVSGVKQAVTEHKFGYVVLNVENNEFYFTTKPHFDNEFPVILVNYSNAKDIPIADIDESVPLSKEHYPEVQKYLSDVLKMLEEQL